MNVKEERKSVHMCGLQRKVRINSRGMYEIIEIFVSQCLTV